MNQRDKIILRTTIGFLTIGMAMSFNLWTNDRNFPLVPVSEILNVPVLVGYMIIGLLFVLLIVNMLSPKRWLIVIVFSLLVLLALQDQIRWQPWFYHYLLFLFPFCLKRKHFNIAYFQIIVAGIYFWSGVNKFNTNFIDNTFPSLVFQMTDWEWNNFHQIAFAVPLFEILIGIGLLFKRTRKWVLIGACITHALILIYLSPMGSNANYVVMPWNIAMVCFLYLLFYKVEKHEQPLKKIWTNPQKIIEFPIICLFLILPILNFIGRWDHYLSFNLYSGKNEIFYIAVEEREIDKLKFDLSKTYVEIEGLEGGKLIDINKWSMNELNVPIPPEKRIFKAIAKPFCNLNIANQNLMFLEIKKPIRSDNIKSYTCNELK